MSPKYAWVVLQVRYYAYVSRFRSNDPCIIALPLPMKCREILSMLWLCFEILLSGDVEINPGPTVEEMLKQVLANQTKAEARLISLEGKVDSLKDVCNKVLELESTVRDLEWTIRNQQERITDLEDRSRRNNIIVYGVKESVKETRANIERKVLKDIFLDRLDIGPP